MTDLGDRLLLTEAWPETLGRPATTQGNYGRNGNLEIVACAADYGLLVGWFNTEDEDDHSGAAVGRWSGALRFGGELRYVTSTITQVSHGPDYLEVLALTDGGSLRRLVWAPETGFVDQGAFAEDVTAHSAVHELVDGTLVTALVTAAGLASPMPTPVRATPDSLSTWGQRRWGTPCRTSISWSMGDISTCWRQMWMDASDSGAMA